MSRYPNGTEVSWLNENTNTIHTGRITKQPSENLLGYYLAQEENGSTTHLSFENIQPRDVLEARLRERLERLRPRQQPQVASLIRPSSQALSPEQFRTLFNILDEDGSGTISIEELATFFLNISIDPQSGQLLSSQQRTNLLEVEQWPAFITFFRIYDTDRNGVISLDELRHMINSSHPNVIASIIGMLDFRLPDVNIRPGPIADITTSSVASLTKTTNLSLPGQLVVTLEKLEHDLKEYEGSDLATRIGLPDAERITEPTADCQEIHQHAMRMIYSEEGLRDLGHIGGQIGNTNLSEILTTFQNHLERGWNYNQQRMPQTARYQRDGLTRLLRHLLTDTYEGLQNQLPA